MGISDKFCFCDFCQKIRVNKKSFVIYSICFFTNKTEYIAGILKIEKDLDKYLFNKGYHISPTQVILLRPDMLLKFLQYRYNSKNEKVERCKLKESFICSKCYIKYKKEIPNK